MISFTFGASMYDALNTVGNVCEWTADFYDPEYYSYSPAENPLGPPSGTTHTLRGGSFQNTADYVRSATRNRDTAFPENLYNVGFRCALSMP